MKKLLLILLVLIVVILVLNQYQFILLEKRVIMLEGYLDLGLMTARITDLETNNDFLAKEVLGKLEAIENIEQFDERLKKLEFYLRPAE